MDQLIPKAFKETMRLLKEKNCNNETKSQITSGRKEETK